MHYTINGYVIESELSAKSPKQTNRIVLSYISTLPKNYKVLDYGCGKLRYSIPLAFQTSKVYAIDSIFQIGKIQKIHDVYIAPKDYKLDNLIVQDITCDEWKREKFDVVLCVNVLSAIPDDEERKKVIFNSKNVLVNNGHMFIAVQYRNSYFEQYKLRSDAIKYNDGWLIKRRDKKCSFYGLVELDKVVNLCKLAGFNNFEIKKHDGSYYIKAFCRSVN